MRLEVTSCCGGVAALCANKRLLSRVGEHVSLEDTSCCAGVVALFANKRLLSTVNHHVHFQMISFDGWVAALQCTMCTLYSFFSPRPSAVGYIVQPHTCHIIEHIFVPTRSVEGNIEKIRFSWVSNSKFVIFPQIYPCSNYKIFPNVPLLFPVSNGDSPVVTTFPRSNYRGFLTTGESYCTMYTLCIA